MLVVQVAIVSADAGAHGHGGGVGGVGGQGGQFEDEAVLADADLLEADPDAFGAGVGEGLLGGGFGGDELGEPCGAAGSECVSGQPVVELV